MNDFDENRKKAWIISEDEDCQHDSKEMLGSDQGNNRYFRCQACEAIFVVEGERDLEEERRKIEREREEEKSGFDQFMEKIG